MVEVTALAWWQQHLGLSILQSKIHFYPRCSAGQLILFWSRSSWTVFESVKGQEGMNVCRLSSFCASSPGLNCFVLPHHPILSVSVIPLFVGAQVERHMMEFALILNQICGNKGRQLLIVGAWFCSQNLQINKSTDRSKQEKQLKKECSNVNVSRFSFVSKNQPVGSLKCPHLKSLTVWLCGPILLSQSPMVFTSSCQRHSLPSTHKRNVILGKEEWNWTVSKRKNTKWVNALRW